PGDVEQMHQDGGAREVAEKARAEAVPGMRPRDEAGHVGQDEALLVADAHDTEVRDERREGIVRDARAGRGHGPDQRRLADVREAEEAGVREDAKLEPQLALL